MERAQVSVHPADEGLGLQNPRVFRGPPGRGFGQEGQSDSLIRRQDTLGVQFRPYRGVTPDTPPVKAINTPDHQPAQGTMINPAMLETGGRIIRRPSAGS